MENKKTYVVIKEATERGFYLGTCVIPYFFGTFSDAYAYMTEIAAQKERERFSGKKCVESSSDDEWTISSGASHSVTLWVECLEEYSKREPSGRYNAIDLGLSVKWCDRNVGTSSPQDYGDFFMWGSVTPDNDNVCDWEHAPFNNEQKDFDKEYFNAHKSKWVTENRTLKPEYDAAHMIMGGSWRMPTSDEIQELLDNTTLSDEKLNGVKGIRFTSKVNGNSIFFPSTGFRDGSEVYSVGNDVSAWSSSLSADSTYSHSLSFDSYGHACVDGNCSYTGFVVRGVCA